MVRRQWYRHVFNAKWRKIGFCRKIRWNLKLQQKKVYEFNIKYVYINKFDDLVNNYNRTCHITIKMNPADVKSSTYVEFNKKNNKEDPKFEGSNHVRIRKYKNIFAKGYISNWSEEVFVIIKVLVPWMYVISYLKFEEIARIFYKKELP